jgi:hypothetical protein
MAGVFLADAAQVERWAAGDRVPLERGGVDLLRKRTPALLAAGLSS